MVSISPLASPPSGREGDFHLVFVVQCLGRRRGTSTHEGRQCSALGFKYRQCQVTQPSGPNEPPSPLMPHPRAKCILHFVFTFKSVSNQFTFLSGLRPNIICEIKMLVC